MADCVKAEFSVYKVLKEIVEVNCIFLTVTVFCLFVSIFLLCICSVVTVLCLSFFFNMFLCYVYLFCLNAFVKVQVKLSF